VGRFALVPHPDRPPDEVGGVAVEVVREEAVVRLRYAIADASRVVWPAPLAPDRADELWRTTCFELFLRFDDHERYVEFNFSPSTQWAAYAFDGYREGMAELPCLPPRIARTGDGVEVVLDLGGLPHGELAMALTAVIEEQGGTKSYWSLAHPPGPPDFHHPACFVAWLPSPAGS
jgi:hypothetical protein